MTVIAKYRHQIPLIHKDQWDYLEGESVEQIQEWMSHWDTEFQRVSRIHYYILVPIKKRKKVN
jgi:hypothetical protein